MKMTNTVYLFIEANDYSVRLLEKILIMMSGGYTLQCSCLQPVLIVCADDSHSALSYSEKTSELVRLYNHLRDHLKQFKTNLCNANVALPIILKYDIQAVAQHALLPNSLDVQKSLGFLSVLGKNFDVTLESGDKIIIAGALNDDLPVFVYTRSILSAYASNVDHSQISVVYDLTQILQNTTKLSANIGRSLSTLKEKCKLVVVGKNHTYKPTFSQIQVACAVLDSINHDVQGEPVVKGEKKDLCFSSDNLSSDSAANALVKMGLMEKLRMDGTEIMASSWMKNLRIKDVWDEIPMLSSISHFLFCTHQWMDGMSNTDFSIEIDDGVYNNFVRCLNNVEVLPKTSSQERRRKEATASMLKALEVHLDTDDSPVYKSLTIDSTSNKWDFELGNLKSEMSPTTPFEIMDLAFSNTAIDNNDAAKWRSVCLDLWELFFCCDKNTINQFFYIGENRIKDILGSSEQRLFSFSDVGQNLIDANIYYYITDKAHQFLAYTSPLTGFCVAEYGKCPVEIDSRQYLSEDTGEVCDLKDRNMDFQQFLYSYVNMRKGQFSANFREYVESQIESNKALIQSKGVDIIRMYPQYRKHIPMDIEITQNV